MNIFALLGAAVLVATVSAGSGDPLSADKIKDNAKVFQAELETMMGQEPQKVLDKLTGWKFEPRFAWKTDDPASKDFKANNIGKTKFSKSEIAAVFDQPGQYKVAVYVLLVGTDSATTGMIDESGMGAMKDATHNVQIFTAVRIVFRDEKLIDVRTWPKLESSQVSGGTWRIR